MFYRLAALWLLLCVAASSFAEQQLLPLGDFEHVRVRQIKESGIIGGKTKYIYAIAEGDTIKENAPFDYASNTIWATSNAWARVAGIHKTSCSVEQEKRGEGHCLRLDTKLEEVKVLGMINIEVLVTGSVYLGEQIEPIAGTDEPYQYINMGIPFDKRPKALVLDYKCLIAGDNYVMKYTGFGKGKRIENTTDEAEFYVYLQRRWEDEKGNLYAERVATMRHRMNSDVPQWQNDARFELHYGNIEESEYYKPYMGLMSEGFFMAKNSRGKMKLVKEVGWADENATPTHIILMLTAGNQGAFIGTLGNTLWIDNVRLEY